MFEKHLLKSYILSKNAVYLFAMFMKNFIKNFIINDIIHVFLWKQFL